MQQLPKQRRVRGRDTRRGGFKRGKVHFSRHLPKLQTNRQRHLYRTLQWVKRFSQATNFARQKRYLNLSHKSWILMTTYYLGRRTSRALSTTGEERLQFCYCHGMRNADQKSRTRVPKTHFERTVGEYLQCISEAATPKSAK